MFGPVIIFYANILEKKRIFCHNFPLFMERNFAKIEELFQKIATIAYNMKRVLQIFYFHVFSIKTFG
jgi:hypothetical protein